MEGSSSSRLTNGSWSPPAATSSSSASVRRSSPSPSSKPASSTSGAINGNSDRRPSKSPYGTSRSSRRQGTAEQLKEQDMECPLVWTKSSNIYYAMSLEKLDDLVTLAPSLWDRIVRQIVKASVLLFMDRNTESSLYADIKAILGRCHSSVKMALSLRSEGCPILSKYREALLHVLYSTFVSTVCVFEQMKLEESPVAAKVTKYSSLSLQQKAAVLAIRGQFMLTCYLARSRYVSKQEIPYADAMLAAFNAKEKNPQEGQWKALYGDLLPDDNPRKLTLLQRGYLARRSPLTTVALAQYMFRLNKQDLAFELCTQAVLHWPGSPFAAQAYVSMYLSCPEGSPGREKLSRSFAERCLVRLLQLAPHCLFVVGLAHELLGEKARLDNTLVPHALVLYDPTLRTPWCMPQAAAPQPPQFDSCNCICSSRCCHLTYRAHGTLSPPEEVPLTCYDE